MAQNPMNHLGEKAQIQQSRANTYKDMAGTLETELHKAEAEVALLKARLGKSIDEQLRLERENDFISEAIRDMCEGCAMKATEFCSNCYLRPSVDAYGLWEE